MRHTSAARVRFSAKSRMRRTAITQTNQYGAIKIGILNEVNLALSWNDIQNDSGNIDKVKALRTDPEGLMVFIGKKKFTGSKKKSDV